jgi:hypothetical protein
MAPVGHRSEISCHLPPIESGFSRASLPSSENSERPERLAHSPHAVQAAAQSADLHSGPRFDEQATYQDWLRGSMEMTPFGQTLSHSPQPVHRDGSTTARPDAMLIAPMGQASAQVPKPTQPSLQRFGPPYSSTAVRQSRRPS